MLKSICLLHTRRIKELPIVLCDGNKYFLHWNIHKSLLNQIFFKRLCCQNISGGINEGTQSSDEVAYRGLKYHEGRVKFVQECKENGKDIYPHKFQISHSAADIHSSFHVLCNEAIDSTLVFVAGRIFEKRESSKKLRFFDIIDDGTKLQIVANYKFYEKKENFIANCDDIARGDIVGVYGVPMRTKAGELSLCAKKLQILAPCLHMMPSTWSKLKNSETIQRSRYLDLLFNNSSREKFILRTKVISYIRLFFENLLFMEVETPILNIIPGGANARPFKTHHKDLDLEMFLRVAPELYLKMLIVGGFNKVFEIGRQFRNEGIDPHHNPEFTSCEFYMAYADYEDMIILTEKLISGLVLDVFGKHHLPYHSRMTMKDQGILINYEPPFQRIDFLSSIEDQLKVPLPKPDQLQSPESREYLFNLCKTHNMYVSNSATASKILDKLFETFVEPNCTNPTFVLNYPKIMSPLAKDHRSIPGLTERFEMFIAGKEICNAYTELNDPVEQRLRFQQQEEQREAGDEEAHIKDENYITALEYGLPPTGGWGMGIDRLVMLLLNAHSIKDVIFFPTMRLSSKSKYRYTTSKK